MTHDELLAKIDEMAEGIVFNTIKYNLESQKDCQRIVLALRTVVALCTENTDHHLVDKEWILNAIKRELSENPSKLDLLENPSKD